MTALSNPLALVGRALIGLFFLLAGISKITGFAGTVGYIGSVGLPAPSALAGLTIAIEVLLGLALIIGFKTRFAAIVLAGFTVAAGVLFHNFWAQPAEAAFVQQLLFMKNIAIAGGLLAIAGLGAGGIAIDRD